MYQSRDSSECKKTKPRAGKRVTLVKLPVQVRRFSLIQNVRTDSRAHPAPFSVGSRNSVPRYKARSLTFYLQLESDENACSCASASRIPHSAHGSNPTYTSIPYSQWRQRHCHLTAVYTNSMG